MTTLPIPTPKAIGLQASNLRFFSAYAALETLIEDIPNRPARNSVDELNLLLRDILIDGKGIMDRAIENLARKDLVGEMMEMEDA